MGRIIGRISSEMELEAGVDDLSAYLTIAASDEAKGIVNPLRKIVDGKKMSTNPDKELLNLSVGKFVLNEVSNHLFGVYFLHATSSFRLFLKVAGFFSARRL